MYWGFAFFEFEIHPLQIFPKMLIYGIVILSMEWDLCALSAARPLCVSAAFSQIRKAIMISLPISRFYFQGDHSKWK